MSPILTRPVREQLEHDRVIRQLQLRYKRKHEVVINPGNEQNDSVTVGQLAMYPDVLLYSQGRVRALEGTVEVETGESVNQLEARAEWGRFAQLGVPLHLYVPPSSVDSARRLCAEHGIKVAELWTFVMSFDQVRFTMIYRSPEATAARPASASKAAPKSKSAAPAVAKVRPSGKKPAGKKAAVKKAPVKKAPAKKAAAAPARKGPAKPVARKAAPAAKAANRRAAPARTPHAKPAKRR